MRAWILAAAASAAAACVPSPRHQCASAEQCPNGLCIEGGCARPDPDCTSGASYEPELGGGCVPATAIVDAADDTDAAVTARCNGPNLETCVGTLCAMEDCELGCLEDPAPHCGVFAPANLPADLDLVTGVTADLTLSPGTYRISTDDGSIVRTTSPGGPITILRDVGEGVVAGIGFYPTDEPTVVALSVQRLELESGATLFVHGRRALILVSLGELVLTGTVDAAHCAPPDDTDRRCAGPGGGNGGLAILPGEGCSAGGNAPMVTGGSSGGGAGGGNVIAGGTGGAGSLSAGGPGAPMPCGQLDGTPLVGGSGGGGSRVAVGGGGGGAIQLVAFGRITLTGRIQAGGRGGGGASAAAGGGGGGGGGGTVFLQAPTIELGGGGIAANGGGGGCGSCSVAGTDGTLGTGNAPGGSAGGAIAGGRGGASASQAHDGAAGTDMLGGGGGGGWWGVIRIETLDGMTGMPGFLSPSAMNRGTITVR